MGSNIEQDLVERLKSSSTHEIQNALFRIRKSFVRNVDKMKKLQKYSVTKLIIPLIEHPKFCNISLSIIADGCLEVSFAHEVIKYDGLKALMRVMKSSINDDVQNRACRALGNIAKFEFGFKAVQSMKPLSSIMKFLSETTDANSQQTAVRTLMILGKNSKAKNHIDQENVMLYVAKLLHSSNVQVLISSIKALANLTYNCSISCARLLLELDYLKVLVKLCSHSEKSVRNFALISLKNLSSLEEIRYGLVKAGAVNIFTKILSSGESLEMRRYAVLALCRHLDHLHMWNNYGTDRSVGLKALLTVLQDKHFQDIHISVLTSLIPLSFECNVTEILLNLNVLQILIEILDNFIKKYECKTMHKYIEYRIASADIRALDDKFTIKDEMKDLVDSQKLLDSDLFKEDKKFDSFENMFKASSSPEKSPDVSSHKSQQKWDNSLYGLNSATSDYSGSCSPSGTCSPIQKYSASPELSYDNDVGSPSTGHTSGIWSPSSLFDENVPFNENCWSPVISTHSNSPVQESKYIEFEDNEENNEKDFFPLTEEFNATFSDVNSQENELFKMSVNVNSSCVQSETFNEMKAASKLNNKIKFCDNLGNTSNKKLKTDVSIADNQFNLKDKIAEEMNEKDSPKLLTKLESTTKCSCHPSDKDSTDKASSVCSKNIVEEKTNSSVDANFELTLDVIERIYDVKSLYEKIDRETIDRYVILFMLQISFHMEKKTNFPMAEKSFFSVIIDYACLIHNPCSKAKTLLLYLIKNRYCLEKLISNGFFCELENKINHYHTIPCNLHSDMYSWYNYLMQFVHEEMKSDYAIGTLSRILVTSDKMEQFNAICTSKFVTDKTSLYKILTEANGLPLLLKFLSDSDETIQMKTSMVTLDIYQSLQAKTKKSFRKVKKDACLPTQCCLGGTCQMVSTSKCFYKESFLDVTFVVSGGAKILANREKISENSDYFKALLQGDFQESSSQLIVLPDIAAENLSTIFHFLHGCGNGSCCPYITRIPFSVLLELLSDCERLLLTDIKIFVEDRLYHNNQSPSHIAKSYKQSKLHNSLPLAEKILRRALHSDTSRRRASWIAFKELLDVGSSVNIYEDIEILLKSEMTSF